MIIDRIATCFRGRAGLRAAFAITLALATFAHAADHSGTFAAYQDAGLLQIVVDGEQRPFRLYGVAGLEPGQPYATEARTFVQEWAMDQRLQITIVTEDEAGVPVAWIRREAGDALNEALLAGGYAWWDRPNAPDAHDLKRLTAQALATRQGLWADHAPLAPWDNRARQQRAPVRYNHDGEKDNDTPKTAVPTLEAKGTPAPNRPKDGAAITEEYAELVGKHMPRIARDGAGKPLGLTASDITAIPGAAAFGFQEGDIVQSVNGITITSELQVLALIGQLQGAKQLDLTVIRAGKPVQVVLPLE